MEEPLLGKLKQTIKRRMLKLISPENMLFLIHFKQSKKGIEFPFRRTVFMEKEMPTDKRMLVIAPHPDDEVLGPGGALSRYQAAGNDILVVYMSDGSVADADVTAEKMQQVRKKEAETIGQKYGFKQKFLNYKDGALEANEESISAMKGILKEYKPHRIYLPSFMDSHRDHVVTNQVLVGALKGVSFSGIDIFGYEVWTNLPFPNYAVDITGQFEKKIEMVSVYESQTAIFDYQHLCQSRNSLNHTMYVDTGSRGYAEVFLHFSAASFIEVMDTLL